MKSFFKSLPSLGVSLLINVSVIAALYFVHRSLPVFAKEMLLESIFTEEMPQEEVTREVELDTAPAETLNVIAGGTPSTVVGASAQPAAAPVNVQKAAVMKEVNIRPVTTDGRFDHVEVSRRAWRMFVNALAITGNDRQ